MTSKLCPACLSRVEPHADSCSQCGASLRAPRRKTAGFVALSVVLGAAVLAWLWLRPDAPPAPSTARMDAAAPPPSVEAPPRHHLVLTAAEGDEPPVVALVLTARGGPPALVLPLTRLPLRGALSADGQPLNILVRSYDMARDVIVLTPVGPLPQGVAPWEAAGSGELPIGTELRVENPDGSTPVPDGVQLVTRAHDGWHLRTDGRLAAGAALLVAHRAVGYALGGPEAIAFDPWLDWLAAGGTRELAAVQQELKQWLPRPLLEEAKSLLEAADSMDEVHQALPVLERAMVHARGSVRGEIDQAARRAYLMLVRLQSRTDTAEALRVANNALARFPGDAPLLADAALLSAENGQPEEGMRLFLELRSSAREDAEAIGDRLARGLIRAAEQLVRDRRAADAAGLMDGVVQLFPMRADVHSGHAAALAAAGRAQDALAAASRAAELDPAFAEQVSQYRKALSAPNPDVTEIPLDATGTIRADVRVGGQPIELIVDTGASLTVIPTALAQRLGLWRDDLPKVRVQTASGTLEAATVTLPTIAIGGIVIDHVEAAVLDLPGSLAGKGLLGLSALRRLDMRLDHEHRKLILERRPPASR